MVRRTLNRAGDVTHRGRNTFSTSRLAVGAAGPAKPKGRRNAQPEALLQKTVVQALALMGIDGLWFAVPNGGARSKIEAAILKGMGVKPGVYDICVIWRARFSKRWVFTDVPAAFCEMTIGVGFLELKAPGRRAVMSPQQDEFARLCGAIGVPTAVIQSVDDLDAALVRFGVPRLRDAYGKLIRGEGDVGSMGQRPDRRGRAGGVVQG